MKKFRASIYIDFEAENQVDALEKAYEYARDLPDYYVGGVGEVVKDIFQTAKNLESI